MGNFIQERGMTDKQPSVTIPTALLAALGRWTSRRDDLTHLSPVVVRGRCLVACDGHRLAIVPHQGQSPEFGVLNDDIDKITAVASAVRAPMLDLCLEKERIRVSIGPALIMDVRRPNIGSYPSDRFEELLTKKNGRSLPSVAINAALFGSMSEVEDAIKSPTPVGVRHVVLASWGDALDGVVFTGHTGATYMIMPVRA
jgi:hypothetical protein